MIRVIPSVLGWMLSSILLTSTALAAEPVTSPDAAPSADSQTPANPHPRVALETTQGRIVVELDRAKAPLSVENFLTYVEEGHYNGTIFHRVIPGFMIQGGGYTADFQHKPSRDPLTNEANNGLKNITGSIAMARTRDPHSATAQFFINVSDNAFLDFRDETLSGWGYAVFGKVVEGMDTVERIVGLPTGRGGPFPKDVPQTTVLIEKAEIPAGEQKASMPAATEDPAATVPK